MVFILVLLRIRSSFTKIELDKLRDIGLFNELSTGIMDNNTMQVQTGDGSNTLFHPQVGEHYHSKHGAVQESKHVFVGMGLDYFKSQTSSTTANVLEVGFGTGLNFLLSAAYAQSQELKLSYQGIEAYPLPVQTISQLGYENHVSKALAASFLQNYEAAVQSMQIVGTSRLTIAHVDVLNFQTEDLFDVLYFDAFAAVHQPSMWTEQTLAHVCTFLKPGGIFVTYAITGHLKRTMKSLDFDVDKVPGAPGKREMLRAIKQRIN